MDKHLDLILGSFGKEKPVEPPSPAMGSIFGSSLAPSSLLPVTPVIRPEPVRRMAYFAFDFDDLMRVNNVRQTGKIGFRVMPRSRGFLDRSVWEASKAFTDRGLKEMMQRASKFSSVACVIIGSNTWFSRWVRYEIALAIINQRGLLAIDVNNIKHHVRQAPDPLGLNPSWIMGK
ncbi:MAG: TIR domain-containing protein [Halobacteriota archaeon]